MAVIPSEVKELFASVPAVVFATADANGQPNASIVGIKFVIDDETVYLSDQFFKKTLANVQANEKVSIVFWEGQNAYQIHGTASYVNEGEQFAQLKSQADGIFAQMGLPIVAKGGVFVHVDELFCSAAGPHAGEKIA